MRKEPSKIRPTERVARYSIIPLLGDKCVNQQLWFGCQPVKELLRAGSCRRESGLGKGWVIRPEKGAIGACLWSLDLDLVSGFHLCCTKIAPLLTLLVRYLLISISPLHFGVPLAPLEVISNSRNIAFGILIANLFKSTIRGLGQSPPRLDVYSSIHDKNGPQFRWFFFRFSFLPKYPPPPCRLVPQYLKRRPALIPLYQYGPRGETSPRHHT